MFNSKKPSKKFLELTEFYKSLHSGKITGENPNKIYNGIATMVFAKLIKKIIEKNKINYLLDYGSGKGDRYFERSSFGNEEYPPLKEYWKIEPTLFDPGVPYPKPQNKTFDMVISIDVLEHVPLQDLNWVIEEIFNYSEKIVFLNVACFPAERLLLDGSNAHVSLFHPLWWCGFVTSIAGKYNKKCFLVCTSIEKGNFKYNNFAINDKFENYVN